MGKKNKGKAKQQAASSSAAAATKGRASAPMDMSKLDPIYNALDTVQYKQALKVTDALLNKHPNEPILVVLKALIYAHTDRRDEAAQLCELVQMLKPTHATVLSHITAVYKQLKLVHDITVCYENAVAQRPDDLNLLSQLFFAHAREYDAAKCQQVAMRLYKLTPAPQDAMPPHVKADATQRRTRYLIWSALNVLLQCEAATACAAAAKPSSTLLMLSTRLVERSVAVDAPLDAAALCVLVDLHLRQVGSIMLSRLFQSLPASPLLPNTHSSFLHSFPFLLSLLTLPGRYHTLTLHSFLSFFLSFHSIRAM
jgi:N-terminal acetyltransferase B complex non-catalytic subunit